MGGSGCGGEYPLPYGEGGEFLTGQGGKRIFGCKSNQTLVQVPPHSQLRVNRLHIVAHSSFNEHVECPAQSSMWNVR